MTVSLSCSDYTKGYCFYVECFYWNFASKVDVSECKSFSREVLKVFVSSPYLNLSYIRIQDMYILLPTVEQLCRH